jgi:3-oxoacyl-(acyl-carrier-protein) synthase
MRSQGSSNARDLKHVEVFESRLPLLVSSCGAGPTCSSVPFRAVAIFCPIVRWASTDAGTGDRVTFFPVDNVNALDTQRHFGEPIRRGKRDRREGRDDRLDRLAGLAYAASVRAFAAAGAEWLATPSVGPRRRSDSPAPMFGPSWGLFVDKLVGPGREAGEPAHWSWLIAGV